MRTPSLLWTVAAALAVPATSTAQPWSRFLGPGGSATAPAIDLPSAFTVADYVWQVPLPGHGHSSPVVWDDQLFLTLVTAETERAVMAFDTRSGAVLWDWAESFVPHSKHKFNEFASSTPCLDEQHLYVFWSNGNAVEALAITHGGELAWRRELGPFEGDHGSGSSPVLVDGKLFVFWDHLSDQTTTYTALDPATGTAVWEHLVPWPARDKLKTSYSSPLIYTNSKGASEIVISSMAFGIQSFDPATGEENWRYDPESASRTVASPVAAGRTIFVTWGSGNGAKDHVAIVPGSETRDGKPQVAWRRTKPDGSTDNKGLPYVPTPLYHEGLLYLWTDSGLLQVLKAADGEPVYGPVRIGGEFYSNPLLIGDRIFCASRNLGEMIVAASGPEFEILARTPLSSSVNATPAVANGKLFIRTDDTLICVGR